MTQGYNAGQPIETTLAPAAHALINHAGLPGIGDLTTAAHALLSHATLPGVGNLATAPGAGLVDHTTLNHASIPGVLSTASHAAIDHNAILGVAPLKQAAGTVLLITTGGFGPVTIYTIPANTLAADGASLEIELWNALTGASAGDPIEIKIGGVNCLAAAELTPPSGDIAIYRLRVVRTGASASTVTVTRTLIAAGAMGAASVRTSFASVPVTWSASQAIAINTIFTGGFGNSAITYLLVEPQRPAV
jgi:hypothetical protein